MQWERVCVRYFLALGHGFLTKLGWAAPADLIIHRRQGWLSGSLLILRLPEVFPWKVASHLLPLLLLPPNLYAWMWRFQHWLLQTSVNSGRIKPEWHIAWLLILWLPPSCKPPPPFFFLVFRTTNASRGQNSASKILFLFCNPSPEWFVTRMFCILTVCFWFCLYCSSPGQRTLVLHLTSRCC